MTSQATRQASVREVIRRYMTRSDHEGPVTLGVEALAERFNQPAALVRAALESLASETGRGVHQLSKNVFEYRPVERTRKKTDTQVRIKAARYMQGTVPGSLHMVQDVARACKTLPASTSGALKTLSEDPYLYIVKVGYGTYSYRPPGTPNSVEVKQDDTSLQPEPVATEAPTPAAMPPRRHTMDIVDLSEPAPAGEEEGQVLPNLARLLREHPDVWGEGKMIPEGYLRIVHTTSRGTRLAEDHEGNLHKVIPIDGGL